MKIKTLFITFVITLLFRGISLGVSDVELLRNMALSSRHRNISSLGYDIQISQEENLRNDQYTGSACKASWIAVGLGTGIFTTNKFEFALNPTEITHDFYTYNFQQSFSTVPAFIAGMQTHNGGDTASMRYRNLTLTSADIQVQEEQSGDVEMNHNQSESIGYIIAEPGNITTGGSIIGEIGSVTVSMQKDQWHPISLNNTYTNPVMVIGAVSYNDTVPITVVLNKSDDKFYFQLSEWEYLDKIHPQETVSYIVIEAGEHVLDNGIEIKAGVTDALLYTWSTKTLPTAFSSGAVPLMFSVPTFFMPYDVQTELTGNSTIQEYENTSFTVTRGTDVGTSTANYEISGTAVNGTDYETLSGSVTFTNGQSSVTVVINPVDDSLRNLDRTINLYFPSLIRDKSIDILLLDDEIYENEFTQQAGSVEIFCGENGYMDLNNSSFPAEIVINPPESGSIELKLFDLLGTLLWSKSEYVTANTINVIYWRPSDCTDARVVSGIYIFYINGAGISTQRKMAVIK